MNEAMNMTILKKIISSVFKPTPLNFLTLFIAIAGFGVAVYRFIFGLGSVSNLSDEYPWGIWIAFDIMSGVALAAGGFIIAGTVHIFNLKEYKPVVKPAVLTAFLGYFLVILGLMVDVGLPWRIYHPLIFPQVHSAMLEVAMCVMFYFTVLFFEFIPNVFQRMKWHVATRVIHIFTIPLVIIGITLSCLHQSSLGSLLLLTREQMSRLWYTPSLPFNFFLQAVSIGLAMVVFESQLSSRTFGRPIENVVMASISKGLRNVLVIYLIWRALDFTYHNNWSAFAVDSYQTFWFSVEWVVGVIIPIVVLSTKLRENPVPRFWIISMVIFGIVLGKVNAALTSMSHYFHKVYFPSWGEVLISAAIISAGILLYQAIVRNLPILEEEENEEEVEVPEPVLITA
jgi:Ni/Fe-hydrogenase subunit HybB-like protein